MTKTSKILNGLYYLTVLLCFLDGLTSFDIKSQTIKSFVYFGILIGTPLIFIWNIFSIKKKPFRLLGLILPFLLVIFIVVKGPIQILFSSGTWRTQTILYQNGHLNFKKIEYQMQDKGAMGYNKRTVEVLYLTRLFMITSEVPKDIGKRVEWIKVDKEVNELGLKEL